MTQISNPLTGKSYPVAGPAVLTDPDVDHEKKQHRPLITYSSVFGGLFVIAFVFVNDFGLGRSNPVAMDSERMVVSEPEREVTHTNSRLERRSKPLRKGMPGAKKQKGKSSVQQPTTPQAKKPENISVGLFEGAFCRGAKRSTFCD